MVILVFATTTENLGLECSLSSIVHSFRVYFSFPLVSSVVSFPLVSSVVSFPLVSSVVSFELVSIVV